MFMALILLAAAHFGLSVLGANFRTRDIHDGRSVLDIVE
jgi:hypothetical protein